METARILIVEDEFLAAQGIQADLEKIGHIWAGTAKTGPEALELVRKYQPDLVLMDIRLEGSPWDGIETAERILSYRRIPVVFLTSLTADEVFEQAIKIAQDGFLSKSVTAIPLKRAIQLALFRKIDQQNDNSTFKGNSISLNGKLYVKNNDSAIVAFDPLQVTYIKAENQYSQIFLKSNKKVTCKLNIKAILELFNIYGLNTLFYRVHKSYVVGLNHIEEIRGTKVILPELAPNLDAESEISIGRKPEFKAIKNLLPILQNRSPKSNQ